MKNKVWFSVNLLLLALVVFLAFGERGNAQKKDVWEYKIQRVNLNPIDKPEYYLNQTGQDGWELVSVDFFPNELAPVLIFKRKK